MSKYLDKIKGPEDVKALSPEACDQLASELRDYIIKTVARTGGHLASNLGVIELTLALLRVFDFPQDQIVWDVGHQSYAYKILTGRKEAFETLRSWQGMAGFPKREESVYDAFNTGHSSTSISAALGLLRAAEMKGEKRKVIAVIGDGAMTGGMAYEALNDAGASDENLIVILNDNQMSIAENVGGLARHLSKLRTSKSYRNFKGRMERFCLKIPGIGKSLADFLLKLKDFARRKLFNQENAFMESLGFKCYGPFNGHDRGIVEQALQAASEIEGPVLIHLCTVKGQGYVPAESAPQNYHGVAPFEIETGVPEAEEPDYTGDSTEKFENTLDRCKSFTEAFGNSLQYFAMRNDDLVGICAAMSGGTGMEPFAKLFPERFFDVGIAEQHAVTLAAGMAAGGIRPIVAIYATFIQRALDQIQHDVVLQNLPVVFCFDRSGVVGEDGETHQGLYDLAYLQALPGGRIWAPADYSELYVMLREALNQSAGPIFIRYPKGRPAFSQEDRREIRRRLGHDGLSPFDADRAACWLRRGKDLNFVSWGYGSGLCYQAAKALESRGADCGVLDLRSLKPLDWEKIKEAAEVPMVILEEALFQGGVGEKIEAELYKDGILTKILCLNIRNEAVTQGKRSVVLEHYGITAEHAAEAAMKLLAEGGGRGCVSG